MLGLFRDITTQIDNQQYKKESRTNKKISYYSLLSLYIDYTIYNVIMY